MPKSLRTVALALATCHNAAFSLSKKIWIFVSLRCLHVASFLDFMHV